jgi:hypothetical protein
LKQFAPNSTKNRKMLLATICILLTIVSNVIAQNSTQNGTQLNVIFLVSSDGAAQYTAAVTTALKKINKAKLLPVGYSLKLLTTNQLFRYI